jgi:glucans biosynthesis protein
MFERRDVLKFALGSLAVQQATRWDTSSLSEAGIALAYAQEAQPSAPPPPPSFGLADPTPFEAGFVTETARNLSKQPFKASNNDLPEALKGLSYEQYVGIRNKSAANIWATENTGFSVTPLHRGFIFSTPMQINLVAQGQARRVIYDQNLYDVGKLAVPRFGDIGFSGFSIQASQGEDGLSDIAIFQGASFFRAMARGQNPGVMARALSIKTADPRGEEFPAFRTVWIERPTLAVNALVVHAIIDSESLTGAYRFTIRPGEATIIDTECTFFARAPVDHFGLATMSATHLLGPIDRRRSDDIRPNVAEIGGLQMLTGNGEWIWRPVANRDTLQISTFVDDKPRGFGFLQRDRDFERYQDDDQHWEKRPSLWIEPIGDWSSGGMQLVEIPTETEANDNIITYWRPKQVLTPGSETSFAYRQFWCWSPPERPNLAVTTGSYSGRGLANKRRRFIVEFSGDILADQTLAQDVKPSLSISPGALTLVRIFRYKDFKVFRVLFEFDPGNETSCEMRLVLEASGKPVSETWLYRWTP